MVKLQPNHRWQTLKNERKVCNSQLENVLIIFYTKKEMFQKKKVSWRMKSKTIMLQYMRVKHQKNLMHTFLSQF